MQCMVGSECQTRFTRVSLCLTLEVAFVEIKVREAEVNRSSSVSCNCKLEKL